MGKWVLRYLFSNLIDEEIRRDEEHRKILETERQTRERLRKENVLTFPPSFFSMVEATGSPLATQTGKTNPSGYSLFPQTPGMGIGIATPATFITTPADDGNSNRSGERQSGDYFSAGAGVSQTPAKNDGTTPGGDQDDTVPTTPSTEKEKEEKGSRFGSWRPFAGKKIGRSASTDMGGSKPAITDEKPLEQTALEEIDKPDILEETLGGVIRRIRTMYETQDQDGEQVPTAITPSLPNETPVLRPSQNTTIIIQEDKPDSGGVADLYRGTVSSLGEDADLLERVAPAWLGELILLNRIPFKETMKVSFVLVPWQDELPVLPSESGRCAFPPPVSPQVPPNPIIQQ